MTQKLTYIKYYWNIETTNEILIILNLKIIL